MPGGEIVFSLYIEENLLSHNFSLGHANFQQHNPRDNFNVTACSLNSKTTLCPLTSCSLSDMKFLVRQSICPFMENLISREYLEGISSNLVQMSTTHLIRFFWSKVVVTITSCTYHFCQCCISKSQSTGINFITFGTNSHLDSWMN